MKKLFAIAALLTIGLLSEPLQARDYFAYFGTYTGPTSRGIYVAKFDASTGRLSPAELAAEVDSPNFLAVSPDERFLYSVTRGDAAGGGLAVFTRDRQTGRLKLQEQRMTGGNGPCHVSVDARGKVVLTADYGGGSVKSFAVGAGGRLQDGTFIRHHGSSVDPARQKGPHAHCFVASPDGQFALACDLGLDQVLVYRVNRHSAELTPHSPTFGTVPPGAGPRQLAFSPDGKSVYVINEMACSVTAFDWKKSSGKLISRETISLLPPGVALTNAFSGAAIAVRPDGRFVYGTLRGHDSISVLNIDRHTGKLSLTQNVPCGGKIPRGMGIDPTGRWLLVAHQKSETVSVFAIDKSSGRLNPTGQTITVGVPVDVKFAVAH